MKIFSGGPEVADDRRYSPDPVTGPIEATISGQSDEDQISTSYGKRHNLTMRMPMRRLMRLTNGFNVSFENHCHAVALYTTYYKFCRPHMSLENLASPEMAADLASIPLDVSCLIERMGERKLQAVWKRGPYRRRNR